MIEYHNQIEVERPIGEVFPYLADPTRYPEYVEMVQECRAQGPGPIHQGSRFVNRLSFMGRLSEQRFEITEYAPTHKLAFTASSGPIPGAAWSYELESAVDRTLIRSWGQAEPAGLLKIAAPLMRRMIKKSDMKGLQKIKRNLERQ